MGKVLDILAPRELELGPLAGLSEGPWRHWKLARDEGGIAWLVLDKAGSSANTLSTEVLTELGLAGRVRIRPVPVGVASAAATLSEVAYRLARRPTPPRLTHYAISQVAVERTLDITAARTRLGYRPTPTAFSGAAHW